MSRTPIEEKLRKVMRNYSQSVSILFVDIQENRYGCTISSLASVSINKGEPPLLSFSLRCNSFMETVISSGSLVELCILSQGMSDIAKYFAENRSVPDKRNILVAVYEALYKESLGILSCSVLSKQRFGQSSIYIVALEKIKVGDLNRQSLLYGQRQYMN
jgi:flavin reductase (DIM6/NTAB) family NADH-FMN oxidoreductase RutF